MPFEKQNIWINNKRWDLTFLILSAALVPIPLILGGYFGFTRTTINILVSLLVGAPHVYSTFTRTLMDKNFTKKHALFLFPMVIILPVGVVYLAMTSLTILLTVFFFWASVHVLHQIAYIVDVYDGKRSQRLPFWSKVLDYLVLFSSLYPVASWKLISGQFNIGKITLVLPHFLRHEWVAILANVGFFVLLGLFIIRSIWEWRNGTLLLPKFLLMSITLLISYNLPYFKDLDVAFQGFNTWHSFQYLALTWYINRLRAQRGEIASRLIMAISRKEKPSAFYAFNLGLAVLSAILILILRKSGFTAEQSYYSVALSSLLVHYYIDHLLFTDPQAVLKKA